MSEQGNGNQDDRKGTVHPLPLKHRSAAMTDGPSRAPARAMLKAIGFSDADLKKPLVGIANTWTEIGPCNFHLRQLAQQVKEGIREAGGTPMEFNTIAVSDGITMGVEGMRASLVSRARAMIVPGMVLSQAQSSTIASR